MAFVPSTMAVQEAGVCVARCPSSQSRPYVTLLCRSPDTSSPAMTHGAFSDLEWHMVTDQGSEEGIVSNGDITLWATKEC